MKATEKRIKILEAAKSCFTQFGYEKTTLEDIGKKLGLNKSSLYYYFKNKEEIFTAVVVKEAEKIVDDLQNEFEHKEQPEEKIQVYMKKRLTYYRKVLGLHKLEAESLRQIQPGFHDLYSSLMQREVVFVARELRKIEGKLKDTGLTVIPTKLFISENGFAKLNIALGKGKKLYDKRLSLKAKDVQKIELKNY